MCRPGGRWAGVARPRASPPCVRSNARVATRPCSGRTIVVDIVRYSEVARALPSRGSSSQVTLVGAKLASL
eukprot:2209468-Pleurochrysis_carterae.AAC.1